MPVVSCIKSETVRMARAFHPVFFTSSEFAGALVLSSRNVIVTNSTGFEISTRDT